MRTFSKIYGSRVAIGYEDLGIQFVQHSKVRAAFNLFAIRPAALAALDYNALCPDSQNNAQGVRFPFANFGR